MNISTPLEVTNTHYYKNALCLAPKKTNRKHRHRRVSRLLHGGEDEDCIDNNADSLHDFGNRHHVVALLFITLFLIFSLLFYEL